MFVRPDGTSYILCTKTIIRFIYNCSPRTLVHGCSGVHYPQCWLSYARAFPLRVNGIRDGSKVTLWHTSLRRQTVVSLMSLCCTDWKSPYEQLKACSMVKHFPQAHCDGICLTVPVQSEVLEPSLLLWPLVWILKV